MNRFVHSTLRHFLQAPITDDGSDLGGADDADAADDQDDTSDDAHDDDAAADDADEVVVSIAGEKREEEEEDVASAPSWVKDLRKKNREDQKRIRELEELVRKQEAPKTAAPVLGKKPAMEDDDIDWDADKFEAKLTAWHERKREIEQHEREQQQQADKAKTEWQSKLDGYANAKTALKAKDYDEAEDVVKGEMDQTQQGIIIQVAKDPALMIYALGKNPKKAKELAAIKDYATFAFALGELSKDLKVEKKRSAPPPEKTITGTGRVAGSTDSHLEKLRAEAERTGDQSKVVAYKREQRRKQNA